MKQKKEEIKWRDLALFWFILTTAFRVSEALSLTVAQIRTDTGLLLDTVKISGKDMKRSGHTLKKVRCALLT